MINGNWGKISVVIIFGAILWLIGFIQGIEYGADGVKVIKDVEIIRLERRLKECEWQSEPSSELRL